MLHKYVCIRAGHYTLLETCHSTLSALKIEPGRVLT